MEARNQKSEVRMKKVRERRLGPANRNLESHRHWLRSFRPFCRRIAAARAWTSGFLVPAFLLLTSVSCLLTPALSQQPQAQAGQPVYAVNAKYVQGVGPGYWPTAGAGLTLNIAAGTAYCGTPPTVASYAGGSLTMTASQTNYVYLDPITTCAPASNTTGFVTGQVPLAVVVAGSSAITTISDVRTWSVPQAVTLNSSLQSAVRNLESIRFEDMYPGADVTARINAAYADCPAVGCTIIVPASDLGQSFSTTAAISTPGKPAIIECQSNQGSETGSIAGALTYTGTGTGMLFDYGTVSGGGPLHGKGGGPRDCNLVGTNLQGIGVQVGASTIVEGFLMSGTKIRNFATGLKFANQSWGSLVIHSTLDSNTRNLDATATAFEDLSFVADTFINDVVNVPANSYAGCVTIGGGGTTDASIVSSSFDNCQLAVNSADVNLMAPHFESPGSWKGIPSAFLSAVNGQLTVVGGLMAQDGPRNGAAVSNATWASNTATLTTAFTGYFPVGSSITVAGITPSGYNGTFTVTAATANTLSYSLATNPGAYSSGGAVSSFFQVTNASWASNVATLTTPATHDYFVGDRVVVAGINPSGYNGTFAITAVTNNTLSYSLASNPGAYVSGGTITFGEATEAVNLSGANSASINALQFYTASPFPNFITLGGTANLDFHQNQQINSQSFSNYVNNTGTGRWLYDSGQGNLYGSGNYTLNNIPLYVAAYNHYPYGTYLDSPTSAVQTLRMQGTPDYLGGYTSKIQNQKCGGSGYSSQIGFFTESKSGANNSDTSTQVATLDCNGNETVTGVYKETGITISGPTSAIAAGSCATDVTVTYSGVTASTALAWSFNATPPASYNALTVSVYPTAGNANLRVCNVGASPVTPASATFNVRAIL